MIGRFSKSADATLTLRGVTYTVEADVPLEGRPEFVRLRIKADDGRTFTLNLGDGRGLSPEDRAAMYADADDARKARAARRI